MAEIYRHFSRIAPRYRRVRTTDSQLISYLAAKLKNSTEIIAADVGCGTGRYDVSLFEAFGDRLRLFCLDQNANMLRELIRNLKSHRINRFQALRASAGDLPLFANSLDNIFTFNAVHHFRLFAFLGEAARVLKSAGHLFIYTRLRSQNRRNIWGQFFPRFHEKEIRLYELDELMKMMEKTPALDLAAVKKFKYQRTANLEWLVAQARHHHYSTFYLYGKQEFEEALQEFQENIVSHFEDPNHVSWVDENIMFVAQKNVCGNNDLPSV